MEISRFSLLNVVLFKGQNLGGEEWRALHAVLFLLGLLVYKELSPRETKASSMFPARQSGVHHFAPNLFRKAQLKTWSSWTSVEHIHHLYISVSIHDSMTFSHLLTFSLTLYQTLATNPNIRVQQCMQIIIITISSSIISSKLCK